MPDLILYGTKPGWETPSFSPFVIKLEAWLRLAGLPYERRDGNPLQAPEGKVPYVEIDGQKMGDSQLIIEHLTRARGVRLDEGMTATEAATARAVRRMLEEGLYFVALRARWLEDDGWALQYPAFQVMFPPVIGALAVPMIRRKVREQAMAQGIGRHARDEVMAMGVADIESVATLLGEKAYLLGDQPRSVDATVFAFLWAFQGHPGKTPIHDAARAHNLVDYVERIKAKYWPPTEISPS